MNINALFEQLASDAGRIFKIDLLNQHKDNELLKRVLYLALDPMVNFYIRKIPAYTPAASNQADTLGPVLDTLMNQISTRQVTGNAAIELLTKLLSSLVVDDALVLERIIQKDLRCGVSESTVNRVWPGLVHEYPCMLASGFDQKLIDKITWPAYAQTKMDGMRFNAIVKDGKCEFRSRNGKLIDIPSDLLQLPFIGMAEHYKDNIVFDGELLVVDIAGKPLDRKTGNGILNKAVKGTMSAEEAESVRATIWDAIPLEAFSAGYHDDWYKVRFAKLFNALSDMSAKMAHVAHLVEFVDTTMVENIRQANKTFTKALEQGLEGIILKTYQGVWENKRAKHQIKFKAELECDLLCIGWEEGTGKNVGRLGALQLQSACGMMKVGVGSGFTDKDRDTIKPDVVGKIITVKYNAVVDDKRTETKSLFLPIYLETRLDKSEADTLDKLG